MFENPHTIYMIAKMKHEELLNESRMKQLANEARKINKSKKSYSGKFILFVADMLITTGLRLKRRWAPEVEALDNANIITHEE